MKFKIESFLKKRKYIIGFYALNKINRNNKLIKSKFLTVLSVFSIFVFLFSSILGVFFVGSLAYSKLNPSGENETYSEKVGGFGLIIPSLTKDTFEEISIEQQQVISCEKDLEEVDKKLFIFLPFYLFIPIIFIISSIHEFGHYIMCRRAGVKVKEYGIGCLHLFYIPIPLFFGYVEPSKTHLKKTSTFNFLSIVSSGCALNFIFAIFLFFFMFLVFNKFMYYMFILNLGVMIFNTLPLSPLDGGLFVKRVSKKLNYITSFLMLLGLLLVIFL